MPPLPNVNKVLRIAMRYAWAGDTDVINRTFYQYSGTATLTNIGDVATLFFTEWGTNFLALMSSDISLTDVTVEDLTSSSGFTANASGVTPGSIGTAALSSAACLIVKRVIARRYRGGHSRIYFPGLVTSDLQDDNTWKGTTISAWLAAMAAFDAAISAAVPSGLSSLTPVNVSFYDGFTNFLEPSGRYRARPTTRSSPLVDLIAGYAVNPQVGSQRRRNQQGV